MNSLGWWHLPALGQNDPLIHFLSGSPRDTLEDLQVTCGLLQWLLWTKGGVQLCLTTFQCRLNVFPLFHLQSPQENILNKRFLWRPYGAARALRCWNTLQVKSLRTRESAWLVFHVLPASEATRASLTKSQQPLQSSVGVSTGSLASIDSVQKST